MAESDFSGSCLKRFRNRQNLPHNICYILKKIWKVWESNGTGYSLVWNGLCPVLSSSSAHLSRQLGARENKPTHQCYHSPEFGLKKNSMQCWHESVMSCGSCHQLSLVLSYSLCLISSLLHLQELEWDYLQSHSTSRMKSKEPKVDSSPSSHTTEQWAEQSCVGKSVPIWKTSIQVHSHLGGESSHQNWVG